MALIKARRALFTASGVVNTSATSGSSTTHDGGRIDCTGKAIGPRLGIVEAIFGTQFFYRLKGKTFSSLGIDIAIIPSQAMSILLSWRNSCPKPSSKTTTPATSAKNGGGLIKDAYHRQEFETTLHFLKKHFPKKGLILDAGGGPGRYTVTLASKGYDMTLLDMTPANLEFAKRQIKRSGVRAPREGCDRRHDCRSLALR